MCFSRREFMAMGVAAMATTEGFAATANSAPAWSADIAVLDPVQYEHVMDIVVVTELPAPVAPGGVKAGPDGEMVGASTIVGGQFEGLGGLRGQVLPGNAYSPLVRPDGVTTTEALYRLRSVDGYQIIVHDRGLVFDGVTLSVPVFNVNLGRHDWLNKNIFVCVASDDVPAAWRTAKVGQRERFLQILKLV